MSDRIVVKGAREHNLKDLDVSLPRDQLVVITGLSGSGKSSLAFDTIYAEGQRRYVESLSAYARQFLDQLEKPDVDSIEGLSPAISIEQKSTSRNPRSTVGTVTEVYDYLRLLFATVGKPNCFNCGKEIASQSASQIADRVMKLPSKSRVEILAPVVRGRKGEYRRELSDLRKQGFVRVRIDGETMELGGDVRLSRNVNHDIEVVVDRLLMRSGIDKRLADSLEVALKLADDTVIVSSRPPGSGSHWSEETFSRKFACAACGVSYPEISPRMFSFNSPHGACPDCNGVGKSTAFDPALLIADPKVAVSKGAIAPWGKRLATKYARSVTKISEAFGATASTAYEDLPDAARELILHGPTGGDAPAKAPGGLARGRRFPGILPLLMRRYRESESDFVRTDLEKFMSEMVCETCDGRRLRREAYHVLVSKTPIHEISGLPVAAALERLRGLKLARKQQEIAKLVLREIIERLEFMVDVGLGYLSLDRPTGTLSGGESQRIRLATQIGAGLSGVLYVLDEPSIGLHPRDNHRLLESLRKLTDSGNSVIVVEHDADTIVAADYVVDMGPGAGVTGGYIVSSGTPAEVMQDAASLTGGYLVGRESIPVPVERKTGSGQCLTIRGATHNNLKDVTVEFPLGRMTCVTGVSGSGKSSLVVDTLHAALANQLHGASHEVGTAEAVEGIEQVDKVIDIDQTPIGRTPRSNPATYTGLFTDIRDLFAMLPRITNARLHGRPLLLQCEGRPLRRLQRRRNASYRNAFSPRYLRALRCLRWTSVQSRNPSGSLQRQEHCRCSRDDGGRGEGVFVVDTLGQAETRYGQFGRVGLRASWTVGDHTFGRRGPAYQAGQRTGAKGHRQDGLHTRRADHRAALRGREESARGIGPLGGCGQYGDRHRAPHRCHQDCRLRDRHRPRGRGAGGRGSRSWNPGRSGRLSGVLYGAISSARTRAESRLRLLSRAHP